MHTGEARVEAEGYVGIDVHYAARVMAAGHGGQTLLSDATRSLLGDAVDGITVRDLGSFWLKDMPSPVRLHQLIVPGLQESFPPLNKLAGGLTNLPEPRVALIGREAELAELTGLLRHGSGRLVTLTGTGGTGKTRLALQAARESESAFPAGVVFCDLAPVLDPTLLAASVAQTLGLRQEGDATSSEAVASFVGDRRLLLLLDNFEQIAEAGVVVGDMCDRCGELFFMVTSRVPLRIAGERVFPVGPLTPDAAAELLRARAEEAGVTLPDQGGEPQLLDELCDRLDRLPLAIELAAPRLRLFAPDQLLVRLRPSLPLLVGGARDAATRQHTLRATLDWSYGLLAPAAQATLARLAVFSGGFTIEAAEAVTGTDVAHLETLLDHSFLHRTAGNRLRLLETTREYALEQLVAGQELDEFRRRHARFFGQLAASLGPAHGGASSSIRLLVPELDNFRAALETLAGSDEARELAVALWPLWESLGLYGEGLERMKTALGAGRLPVDARGALAAGWFASLLGRADEARTFSRCALELARDLALVDVEIDALHTIGIAELGDGDLEASTATLTAAVELARGDGVPSALLVSSLLNLATVGFVAEGREPPAELVFEAHELAVESGDATMLAHAQLYLATLFADREQLQPGCEALELSIETLKPRVLAWHRVLPDRRRRPRSRRRRQSFGRRPARLGTRPVREHRTRSTAARAEDPGSGSGVLQGRSRRDGIRGSFAFGYTRPLLASIDAVHAMCEGAQRARRC